MNEEKHRYLNEERTQELIDIAKRTFLDKNYDISLTSDEIDEIIENAADEAYEEVYGE